MSPELTLRIMTQGTARFSPGASSSREAPQVLARSGRSLPSERATTGSAPSQRVEAQTTMPGRKVRALSLIGCVFRMKIEPDWPRLTVAARSDGHSNQKTEQYAEQHTASHGSLGGSSGGGSSGSTSGGAGSSASHCSGSGGSSFAGGGGFGSGDSGVGASRGGSGLAGSRSNGCGHAGLRPSRCCGGLTGSRGASGGHASLRSSRCCSGFAGSRGCRGRGSGFCASGGCGFAICVISKCHGRLLLFDGSLLMDIRSLGVDSNIRAHGIGFLFPHT